MREFNIADIVIVKGAENTLYIVIDYLDYTKTDSKVTDIDYELAQIYPITKNTKYRTLGQDDLDLREKTGSKNYRLLLDFIQKDRHKKGLYGVADYIEMMQSNLAREDKKKSKTAVKVKEVKTKKEDTDVINYHKIGTIDECLEAINDLNILHQMYDDESYLQLKEVVIKRIKELKK